MGVKSKAMAERKKKQTQIECMCEKGTRCIFCKVMSRSKTQDVTATSKKAEIGISKNGLTPGKTYADALKKAGETLPNGSLSPVKKETFS